MSRIGYGSWTAQVVERGGDGLLMELPWSSIDCGGVVNNSSDASVSIPSVQMGGSVLMQVIEEVEPWQHELLLWRDHFLAFAGPVQSVQAGSNGGSIEATDLFTWLEKRFLPTLHADGDVAGVFETIFHAAMDPDTSPNISIQTRLTNVQTTQDFGEDQFHRAADALRALSSMGIDFTMVGRTLLAGGKEVFETTTPLLLHDDGVTSAEVTKDGSLLTTDAAVVGTAREAGQALPTGRAISGDATYGLVQSSFSEGMVRDRDGAYASALSHLEACQPSPRRLRCSLSPEAAFDYEDLVAGKRFDVRLTASASGISIMDEMRLVSFSTSVSASDSGVTETVDLELIPLGEIGGGS